MDLERTGESLDNENLMNWRESLENQPNKTINRTNQDIHLTVHIVSHTHDDVGWLKTYEEYFNGAKGSTDHS